MLEKLVRSQGFESEKEFHHLVASTDTSTPEKYAAFKRWQHDDGSKAGLLKLREEIGTAGPPKPASADRIDEILTKQFGVDIRKTTLNGEQYAVTFDDQVAVIVCKWDDLPAGHSINGQTRWWVRIWQEADDELPDDAAAAIRAVE